MWPEFLHHLTLHFAIVLPMVMAALGTVALRPANLPVTPEAPLTFILRTGGALTFLATAAAVATGLATAGFSGGAEHLEHHRYLGILSFVVIFVAALAFEVGCRQDIDDLKRFGLRAWWIATFAVIGAGHFGGLGEHLDSVPF